MDRAEAIARSLKVNSSQRELENLRRWKAEALPLLELLDRCHDLLPPEHQAPLGRSKAKYVESYLHHVRRLRESVRSEQGRPDGFVLDSFLS